MNQKRAEMLSGENVVWDDLGARPVAENMSESKEASAGLMNGIESFVENIVECVE